jgi:ribonuclease P protein component
MRQPDEFSMVLSRRQSLRSGHVVMYYAANGHNGARLGLIVGRRADRRAVARNLFKRIVREAFRAVQTELPPLDVVVRALGKLGKIERRELRTEVDSLFARLAQ